METTETAEIATTAQRKLPKPATGDRLSSLPDEILAHILSFLPTRYAVGTSGLNRRWKDLWTGLSELDLDHRDSGLENLANNRDEIQETRELDFCRFVDKVLREHKDLNSLRRFRFHFSAKFLGYDEVIPNFWSKMEFASDDCLLEEIDFKLEVKNPRMRCLPESFYSLKSLKVLKLEGVTIKPAAELYVLLPSVTILQLLRVEIKDCESLSRLISGCPVIEALHLEECWTIYRKQEAGVTASLPSLKSLRIIGYRSYVNQLCPIVVEAPSLEHLYLLETAELQLLGTGSPLPFLRSARVDFGSITCPIAEDDLIRLLAQISNAEEMWLSWETLSVLLAFVTDEDGDAQLPIFPNLTHLTIQLDRTGSCVLHSLLNAASKLQYLCIELVSSMLCRVFRLESKEPACTPECLLSSLEEIDIKYIRAVADEQGEYAMVAYLLNTGAKLEKVNLHMSYDDENDDDIYRECSGSLLNLPRGSRACEVHVSPCNGKEIRVFSDDLETTTFAMALNDWKDKMNEMGDEIKADDDECGDTAKAAAKAACRS